jgi:hypothetical protein
METPEGGTTVRDQDVTCDTGQPDMSLSQQEVGDVSEPPFSAAMNAFGGPNADGGGSPAGSPDGAKDGTSALSEEESAASGAPAGTNDHLAKGGIAQLGTAGTFSPGASDLVIRAEADNVGKGPTSAGDGGDGGHSRSNSSIEGSSMASSSMDDDEQKSTPVGSSEQQPKPIDVCATPTRRNAALKDVDAEELFLPAPASSGGESASAEEESAAASKFGSVPTPNFQAGSNAGGVQSIEPSVSSDDVTSASQHNAASASISSTDAAVHSLRRADTAPPQVGVISTAAAMGNENSPRSPVGSDGGETSGLPPRPPPGPNGGGVIRMPPQNGNHHRQQPAPASAPAHQAGVDLSTHSVPNHASMHSRQHSPTPQQQGGSGVVKPPSPTNISSLSGSTLLQEPTTEEVSSSMDAIISSPPVQQSNENIVERSPGGRYLRFQEKLGSGAYKDVYRAYDTIEGIEVAWNVVNLAGVPKAERARIVHEVRLLERLHHKNIISFHGSWVNREREQVIFVTEILSSGTLKSFINKVQVIRWKIAKRWAIQILKGLEYLHSQDPPIIHRDLKCDNIFINGTSGDLRIGDLGLSTVIDNKNKVCISLFFSYFSGTLLLYVSHFFPLVIFNLKLTSRRVFNSFSSCIDSLVLFLRC